EAFGVRRIPALSFRPSETSLGPAKAQRRNTPHSKRFARFGCLFLVAMTLPVWSQTYTPPATHRADLSLDASWRFLRQDVPGAQTNGFDDSAWSLVNLPHTWNNFDGEDGGNNYYRGIGWYRTHCVPDASY